ncbi:MULTISPECIES: hypothetical protein [Nocardiopsidaceae]|uniref:Uncharacterized protein n=1 Tax=Streptomonospora nanhaiensis TaxID=1323731 RepID=A0ABY6YTX7_9ACTN|nr:hypothetical protein [Streptomonospora nanhaiensis]WAE75554.1 hypothetical protein OUQ99_10925 [Streptomonospora nanhaiensis]
MSVRLFDLRGSSPEEALGAVLGELGEGTPLTGADRVVLLDGTRLLAGHAAAYEAVFTSGRVRSAVCVAVGPPTADAGRRFLDRPGQLGPGRGVATLWVGDTTGVDWGIRPPGPPRPRPGVPAGSGAGLEHLLAALGQVEVFDRVVELSGELPEAAASPGLCWSEPDRGGGAADSALAAALRRYASGGGASGGGTGTVPAAAPSRGNLLADLVAGAHRPRPVDVVGGTGELGARERHARDAAAAAEEALASLSAPGGAFARTTPERVRREELRAAGEALDAYRAHVDRLFRELSPLTGNRLAAALGRAGVVGAPPTREEVDEALGALARLLDEGVRGGVALDGLARDLEEVSRRVAPRDGAAPPQPGPEDPDDVLRSLADPPPFPLPGPLSPLLLPAFLLPVLPALAGGPAGIAGGIATALAWVLAVTAGARRARGPGGGLPTAVAHAVAAFSGVLAGLGAGGVLQLGLVVPPPVWLSLALPACAAAGGGVLLYTWSRLARRWRDRIAPERADASVTALAALVDRRARESWYPGAARSGVADAARSAQGAVRAVADAFAGAAAALPPPSSHPEELEAVVRSDLSALARAALEPVLAGLRSGTPVGDLSRRVHGTATDLLEGYREHLARAGAHVPPRFADPDTPRQVRGGPDLNRALDTLRLAPEDRMLQLCDPGHLSLLGESAPAVRAVRFAPYSLRAGAAVYGDPDSAFPDRSAVWTREGALTGVLRLVPLRPGVVRTRWSRTEPSDGGHGGAAGRPVPDPEEDPAGAFAAGAAGGPAEAPEAPFGEDPADRPRGGAEGRGAGTDRPEEDYLR